MDRIPEYVDGLPNLSGDEELIDRTMAEARSRPVFDDPVDLDRIDAAFTIALHMHQPLRPADGVLTEAPIIGNLAWMTDHQDIGDNHNAPVFAQCYRRMGEFVRQLLEEGRRPRVMLDYSGTLLHGLRQMGRDDVVDELRYLATDPRACQAVEWLGGTWGHAVAPSTPVQDFRLHVRAWQHHFAALFGTEALSRVRGFSPAEMALPNHPDVAYEFVRTLLDCGYEWVLVQEHTVEEPDGAGVSDPYLPHRLVCTNSRGETATITAIIKTQGSDTKLVAQMQPYYEAKSLQPREISGRRVPPLCAQIADGENGGVMMNEFPGKYLEVMREYSGTAVAAVNGTEYLDALRGAGIGPDELPPLQPLHQHRVWQRCQPGEGPEKLAAAIDALSAEDDRFHMEGGSWTGDISWVEGYDNVLVPMERASALFNATMLTPEVPTDDPRYRRALFYLLASETSCYRYWGQGEWTDYGAEIARRAAE
ncbi:MAG: glycosyl hydrolase family 57, partial [Catenulispora sp.]|nr:glycosyl hydrolase family 57 [Catenulispora sp.]